MSVRTVNPWAMFLVGLALSLALVAGVLLSRSSDHKCWTLDARGYEAFYDASLPGCNG